ncbi:hypothetical protein GCM10025770_02910 [Viridibacterium curvum]|uniref:Lcl C-terminal domain-containing protein n=2 Tax=Viridibacterium curvum TaxID=1101404 RepID=A0ABP9Q872_9RHOO
MAVVLVSACGGGGGGASGSSTAQGNTAPVANAGSTQNIPVTSTVNLDGSASHDANADALTYKWTIISKPAGSVAALSSTSAMQPTFVADKLGAYVIELVVNDGKVGSPPATVSIVSGWPATGMTKLDAAGLPLAGTATTWSCVRDNATKLVWEVKTSDGGLHDKNKTYTNYDNALLAQKGDFSLTAPTKPSQAEIDAPTNAAGFVNAVNAAGLCGSNDWRLPSYAELDTLYYVEPNFCSTLSAAALSVCFSAPQTLYINTAYFPDSAGATFSLIFWSSSADPVYTQLGTFKAFDSAWQSGTNHDPRGTPWRVRLVRSTP